MYPVATLFANFVRNRYEDCSEAISRTRAGRCNLVELRTMFVWLVTADIEPLLSTIFAAFRVVVLQNRTVPLADLAEKGGRSAFGRGDRDPMLRV